MPTKNDPTKPMLDDIIPKGVRHATYAVDIGLGSLEAAIEHYQKDMGLDMDPDFQRGHVWTREQQVAFVEFFLRDGATGRNIYTNCAGRHSAGALGPYVLVDGKQRLTALLAWLRGEFPVFGSIMRSDVRLTIGRNTLKWHVNDLETREEVLAWYVEMNEGGVVHTKEEIARVKALIEESRRKNARTLPPPPVASSARPRSR